MAFGNFFFWQSSLPSNSLTASLASRLQGRCDFSTFYWNLAPGQTAPLSSLSAVLSLSRPIIPPRVSPLRPLVLQRPFTASPALFTVAPQGSANPCPPGDPYSGTYSKTSPKYPCKPHKAICVPNRGTLFFLPALPLLLPLSGLPPSAVGL